MQHVTKHFYLYFHTYLPEIYSQALFRRLLVSTGVIYTNYLYYIGYAYTVYVAKQNPVKGFGETNIIRDHELMTANIIDLQLSVPVSDPAVA